MNKFDFSVLTAGEPAQFGKYGSLRLRYLKENKLHYIRLCYKVICSMLT